MAGILIIKIWLTRFGERTTKRPTRWRGRPVNLS